MTSWNLEKSHWRGSKWDGHLRRKNEVTVGLCGGATMSSRFNGYTMVEVFTLMYAAY